MALLKLIFIYIPTTQCFGYTKHGLNKHFKCGYTVGISNQAEGVVASVLVFHVDNKHGYTTLKHERFKDYSAEKILEYLEKSTTHD